MTNYSIIIPHKNSLELLVRGLKSIPKRDDIQVIVIDDNSDPDKVDFNKLASLASSRVKIIIDKSGKGAGHARNLGLEQATGKWLLFLDADDFYNEGAFEVFDEYLDSDYDIIYFKVSSVFSDTLKPSNRCSHTNDLIESYFKSHKEENLRFHHETPWCKMIKSSLVSANNIMFDEVIASNDVMFSIKTGFYAKIIHADNFKAYCVTVNKGSLVNTISQYRSRVRFEVAVKKNRFLIDNGKSKNQQRMASEYFRSLKYGIREWNEYTKILIKYKISPFWGLYGFLLSTVKKMFVKNEPSYKVYTNEK